MQTYPAKRFILPFSNPKLILPEAEVAAVFAVAESQRGKGGGLLTRQAEERLFFLSKVGYPIWLFPRNDLVLVFDGLDDFLYRLSYFETPAAKVFMEKFEANSRPRENYQTFLFDHSSYFDQTPKEKQFTFKSLIVDADFKADFGFYRKEASEANLQSNGTVLLSPILDEPTISTMLIEFEKLQLMLREEAEKLPECLRMITRTTSQYITELDYEASASREEADAKIKAQEGIVKPQIAKLNKEYRQKIKKLSDGFDREIERIKKLRVKTQRNIQTTEEKIRLYQHEADAQGAKGHKIYEKRWKEKIKKNEKDLKSLKNGLKKLEDDLKRLSQQKSQEIAKLNFELDSEVKFARQPLLELQAARDAKMATFKQQTEILLKLEKPVIEGLNKNIKLREAIKANFEALGVRAQEIRVPTLFFVPFYVACFESGLSRRYLVIPPSAVTSVDFSAKLKGAFGMSKTKDLLMPRFRSIAALIGNVPALTQQNSLLESQLYSLGQKTNLLASKPFVDNVKRGLVYLQHQGWLSDKEEQSLSNRLMA